VESVFQRLYLVQAIAQDPLPSYSENKQYWAEKAKQINKLGDFRRLVGDVKRNSGKVKYGPHTARTVYDQIVRTRRLMLVP